MNNEVIIEAETEEEAIELALAFLRYWDLIDE